MTTQPTIRARRLSLTLRQLDRSISSSCFALLAISRTALAEISHTLFIFQQRMSTPHCCESALKPSSVMWKQLLKSIVRARLPTKGQIKSTSALFVTLRLKLERSKYRQTLGDVLRSLDQCNETDRSLMSW